jgi:hypothetical protein
MTGWLLIASIAAALLVHLGPSPAQEVPSSIVGVWKLNSLTTREVTTGEAARPFGEHPSGYFFFTRGGKVAFFAVAENRKAPASAPTDAERAELYKSIVAGFTGSYTAEQGKILMQVDASWNQAWTGTQQPRNVQIANNQMTVTTPPFKNLMAGKEFVVTAIFDRVE